MLIASMCFPAQILLIPHFLTYDLLGWIGTYKPLIVPAWLGGGAINVFTKTFDNGIDDWFLRTE